jgi:uncharacterized protein (TIGR00725 family)
MKTAGRKWQIGVMGSCDDLVHTARMELLADEVGRCIAQSGNILVYGANKDIETLPTAAARGAKSAGGTTVGVTYGSGREVLSADATDIVIATGSEKGGGREFVLINSCDAIIILNGGAGTLIETAVAYEMHIPIISLPQSGGWAEKLAGSYLDARERVRIMPAHTPLEAVKLALEEINKVQ